MLPKSAAALAKLLDVAAKELKDFSFLHETPSIVLKSIVFDDREDAL